MLQNSRKAHPVEISTAIICNFSLSGCMYVKIIKNPLGIMRFTLKELSISKFPVFFVDLHKIRIKRKEISKDEKD